VAEIAAGPSDRSAAADSTSAGGRVSGSAAVVIACTLVVAAALATFVVVWVTSATTGSTSYTATLPGTLLGIEIALDDGDVEIVGASGTDVFVERTDSGTFGLAPSERRMILGNVFRIESSCPRLVVGSCEAHYRLSVPEKVRVTIEAARGDVRVNAHRGLVDLSTRAGDISVEAFCGTLVRATAKGGDVDVSASCPPQTVEVRTDTGDVRVAVPPGMYSIEADSNAGNAEVDGLTALDTAPFRIQALSNSGDVIVRPGT
jgi:Putative adhesin